LGVLKGLIHRAHQLCDLKDDLLEELDLLRDVFIANGYPAQVVVKTIEESWERETLKTIFSETDGILITQKPEEFYDILYAPYIQGFSENVQKKLRKFNVGFVPKKGLTLYDQLCNMKPKCKKKDQKDVVYAIKCSSCSSLYFDETSQHFCGREYQHKNDITNKKETNGIYKHLEKNENHQIDWDASCFVDSERKWLNRRIKESLFIDAFNPMDNITNLMNLDKGIKIDSCWKYFRPTIKNIATEKLSKRSM